MKIIFITLTIACGSAIAAEPRFDALDDSNGSFHDVIRARQMQFIRMGNVPSPSYSLPNGIEVWVGHIRERSRFHLFVEVPRSGNLFSSDIEMALIPTDKARLVWPIDLESVESISRSDEE